MKVEDRQIDEEIEGLDVSWDDYPIDTLLIRSETRTVFDVTRRILKGQYIMNPEFQRDFVWNEEKQNKLIESVLMRIPLPAFYLAEDNKGRLIVVDGLQRLSTLYRFLRNDLKLNLPHNPELRGKQFKDLPPKLQNRIEDCNLVLYIIDAQAPERARLDIFERVNSGEPLTRQQMRNCLYMGPATAFLKTEAASELFRAATGYSLKSNEMRDREFVNRFAAFQLLSHKGYEYRGDMDDFLALALIKMNQMPDSALSELSNYFRNSLNNNISIFGEHAFRKHHPGQSRRSVLNASLWDVMTTGLCKVPQSIALAKAEPLKNRYFSLMLDHHFVESITYSTNSTNQVRYRFEAMNQVFREVFGADYS